MFGLGTRNTAAKTKTAARYRAPAKAAPGRSLLGTGAGSNGTAAQVIDYRAPAPLSAAMMGALDWMTLASVRGKSGRVTTGGRPSTINGTRYYGYIASMQRFYGAQGIANSTSIRMQAGLKSGLPAAASPVAGALSPMQQLLALSDSYNGIS